MLSLLDGRPRRKYGGDGVGTSKEHQGLLNPSLGLMKGKTTLKKAGSQNCLLYMGVIPIESLVHHTVARMALRRNGGFYDSRRAILVGIVEKPEDVDRMPQKCK